MKFIGIRSVAKNCQGIRCSRAQSNHFHIRQLFSLHGRGKRKRMRSFLKLLLTRALLVNLTITWIHDASRYEIHVVKPQIGQDNVITR